MQPRPRLRHRLIRWLGGTPTVPELPALSVGPNGELVLPAVDGARQSFLAGRYFAHAEELIRRGAAELAAPYYRQAYALLHASLDQASTPGAPSVQEPVASSTVVDITQPSGQFVSAASAAAPSAPPAQATADIAALIRNLKSQLTAQTADAVAEDIGRLRQQGVVHPDLDHLHGLVHVLKGESTAAAEKFRMTLAQAPDHYGSLVNLSGLVLAQGRLDEAQALLQKALQQVNPDSVEAVPALTNLSLVHQGAQRRMDEALLVLKIHRLKPGHLRHERLLDAAGVLQDMAEEPAAIEILQWLSEKMGGDAVWRPLATLLERRGDYQAAALVYRQLLQPQPASSSVVD
jgi:tetratricopeptide (TPR) repeat protein